MHRKRVRQRRKDKGAAAVARSPTPRRRKARDVEAVQIAANSYCLRQYAVSFTGGNPRRLSLSTSELWIVPVLFTSPGYGVVGEVGIMAIDAGTLHVVGATPHADAGAEAKRLREGKHDAIQAAFLRAKTV